MTQIHTTANVAPTAGQSPAPVVVTPLDDHMGLDIARALASRGIPVYGVDSDANVPGRFSRYVHSVRSPDPHEDEQGFVRFLQELGGRLGARAVLYPLSDRHVLLTSRHRAALQEFYEFVMPDHETMERLTTKDGLQAVARETGILSPPTFEVNGDGDRALDDVARAVTYPVILKPTESTYWHTPAIARELRRGGLGSPSLLSGRPKVVRCDTPQELRQAYRRLAALDADDHASLNGDTSPAAGAGPRLVVQEVVPGEDSRLVYFSFYLDRDSRPLAIFAGRKLRVIPTGFGSASYVRSFYDPELRDVAFRLLSAVGYQGLGGLEFKKDPRTETYQLIEFNTRFGMWDGLGARCGVDLAYAAYRDALRLPIEPQFDYRRDVIWIDWQRDVRAALEYRRKGELSLGAWLRSLRGDKMWAVYSRDDWRPGLAFTAGLLSKLWDRLTASDGRH